MCFFFCSGLREPHGDSFFSQSNFPKSLFFCCRFVMFQGASRRITSLDPSWHPVVGEPIRTPWIVLFKNLPVIVAFLCFRRVEGKFLSCLLQQEVINLQAQEEEEEKSMLRKTFCTWLNIPLVVSRNIKSVLPFKKQLIYLFIAHLIWLRKQQEKTANIRIYQIFQAWENKRHSGYKPYQLRPAQLTPFPLFPHWCGDYGAPPCASLIATPSTLYKSPFFIRDLKWWIGLHCELHICDLQGNTLTSSRKPNAFSHLKITSNSTKITAHKSCQAVHMGSVPTASACPVATLPSDTGLPEKGEFLKFYPPHISWSRGRVKHTLKHTLAMSSKHLLSFSLGLCRHQWTQAVITDED